jgi:hypothetical protein
VYAAVQKLREQEEVKVKGMTQVPWSTKQSSS